MSEQRPEPHWGMVRVDGSGGPRVRLLSTVIDGVRVFREEHYETPDHTGARRLLSERYWTSDQDRAHRTLEAALAAATEPIEPNTP